MFIGFNMTFFNQFVMGGQGMPRRYYTYVPQFQQQHLLSSVGSYILTAGLFWTLIYLLSSLRKSNPVNQPDDPWGAASLEWKTQSPRDRAQLPRDAAGQHRPVQLPPD